jgi:hypothetical protein
MERKHLLSRWWHRLFVVLFFVSVLSAAVFSWLLVVHDFSDMKYPWRDEAVFRFRSELGEVRYGNTSGVDFVFVPTSGEPGKVLLFR